VQPIGLPSSGSAFPSGTLDFAGFGREAAASPPDGSLNALTETVSAQGTCSGGGSEVVDDDNGIALCAGAATASVCNGDSGGALVTTTTPPVVVGVVSAGSTGCAGGVDAVYTYVGAPEILGFVQGNNQPPVAPRVTAQTSIHMTWNGALAPGTALTCAAAGFDDAPTSIGYAFVDARSNTVLQQGTRSTYALAAANVGAEVFCRALATNSGGTTVVETTSTQPIGSVPKLGIAPLHGIVLVAGETADVRVVLRTPAGLRGKFGACITPPASVGSRACASAEVTDGGYGGYPIDVKLRVRPTARPETARLAISAVAGLARAETTVVVRVARR
jgi:hypothetical protein